jgi:hypothetical protein
MVFPLSARGYHARLKRSSFRLILAGTPCFFIGFQIAVAAGRITGKTAYNNITFVRLSKGLC